LSAAIFVAAAFWPAYSVAADASGAAIGPLGSAVNPALLPVFGRRPQSPRSSPLNAKRLLGVIPDYGTVDSTGAVEPLSPRQKWELALKGTADPFNLANAVMTAAFSQDGNQTPKYGEGGTAYSERFAAAVADSGMQNMFSAGVLANLLHQDPRYFRMGPQAGILKRALYSVSRVAVTRQDSGKPAFNASGLGGMVLGIGASNLYYPSASVHGYVMAERLTTSLTGAVTGNLMSEFLPDLQKKFLTRLFHKKGANQN
jgi:hypothetical protein